MTENLNRHHRRSIRLKGYDYSQEGAYFVTVDVFNRERLFGDIVGSSMNLNEYGKIADECWRSIPEHFPNVELDEYIVMPDHLHGIFFIMGNDFDRTQSVGVTHDVGATHASPLRNVIPQQNTLPPPRGPKPYSVGSIVGSFKSAVSKRIREIWDEPRSHIWQRNYYEHVIRDENELNRIRQYIVDNPAKWEIDLG